MLQKAFMAGGEGGGRGRKAITKTTVKLTFLNTSMYMSAYTDNYRQFLIKIKYICDSGSLFFKFGVCKIDVEQTSNDKGKRGNVTEHSIKQITTETSQTFFSLNHSR